MPAHVRGGGVRAEHEAEPDGVPGVRVEVHGVRPPGLQPAEDAHARSAREAREGVGAVDQAGGVGQRDPAPSIHRELDESAVVLVLRVHIVRELHLGRDHPGGDGDGRRGQIAVGVVRVLRAGGLLHRPRVSVEGVHLLGVPGVEVPGAHRPVGPAREAEARREPAYPEVVPLHAARWDRIPAELAQGHAVVGAERVGRGEGRIIEVDEDGLPSGRACAGAYSRVGRVGRDYDVVQGDAVVVVQRDGGVVVVRAEQHVEVRGHGDRGEPVAAVEPAAVVVGGRREVHGIGRRGGDAHAAPAHEVARRSRVVAVVVVVEPVADGQGRVVGKPARAEVDGHPVGDPRAVGDPVQGDEIAVAEPSRGRMHSPLAVDRDLRGDARRQDPGRGEPGVEQSVDVGEENAVHRVRGSLVAAALHGEEQLVGHVAEGAQVDRDGGDVPRARPRRRAVHLQDVIGRVDAAGPHTQGREGPAQERGVGERLPEQHGGVSHRRRVHVLLPQVDLLRADPGALEVLERSQLVPVVAGRGAAAPGDRIVEQGPAARLRVLACVVGAEVDPAERLVVLVAHDDGAVGHRRASDAEVLGVGEGGIGAKEHRLPAAGDRRICVDGVRRDVLEDGVVYRIGSHDRLLRVVLAGAHPEALVCVLRIQRDDRDSGALQERGHAGVGAAVHVPEDDHHHVGVVVRDQLVVGEHGHGVAPELEPVDHQLLVFRGLGDRADAIDVEDDDPVEGRGREEGGIDVVVHAQVPGRDRGVEHCLVDVARIGGRELDGDLDVPDEVAPGFVQRHHELVAVLVEIEEAQVGDVLAELLSLPGVVRHRYPVVEQHHVAVVGIVQSPEGPEVGVEAQGVVVGLRDRVPVVVVPAAVWHVADPDHLVREPVQGEPPRHVQLVLAAGEVEVLGPRHEHHEHRGHDHAENDDDDRHLDEAHAAPARIAASHVHHPPRESC